MRRGVRGSFWVLRWPAHSAYGFLQGAWPSGVVEAILAVVALRRWRRWLPSLDLHYPITEGGVTRMGRDAFLRLGAPAHSTRPGPSRAGAHPHRGATAPGREPCLAQPECLCISAATVGRRYDFRNLLRQAWSDIDSCDRLQPDAANIAATVKHPKFAGEAEQGACTSYRESAPRSEHLSGLSNREFGEYNARPVINLLLVETPASRTSMQ